MDVCAFFCSNTHMQTSSPTFSPLYRQIKTLIMQGLANGEWKPGESIPSEADLATRFSVSQGTVRKAIDELAAERMLVRRQGKGTYVSTHTDPHAFFRFLRMVRNDGVVMPAKSVPLECWRAKAGAEVSRMLEIPQGTPVTIVRRILTFDNKPTVLDEIYLPTERFQGLSLDVLKEYEGSLYGLFETRYGVRMVRAEERLRAVAADRASAELLKIAEGSPLLSVERVTYTYEDKPVEWRRGLYATADHFYQNDLG